MKKKYDIYGMTCSACSATIDKTLRKLDGVQDVQVNLLQNTMLVDIDESIIKTDTISKAVSDSGYQAVLQGENKSKETSVAYDEASHKKKQFLISLALLIPLMYISMGHMLNAPLPAWLSENGIAFAFTQFLLTTMIMYLNRNYFQVGFKTLLHGSPNMDSLIAVGSGAAYVYGVYAIYQIGFGLAQNDHMLVHQYMMDLYFESAAMILTLITLGKYLETRSKGKTSDAIERLLKLAPQTAIVIRDGVEVEVALSDVLVKDHILVKPGEQIPVDGVVVSGSSYVDESALTGESIPIRKETGSKIMSATLNKNGSFVYEATHVGSDTTLAKIVTLVEEASSSKAPIAKLADKVSGIFVPVVMMIALIATITWLALGYSFSFALSIGIAVLVISCPCALGLATPTAIMVGTGKGAEHGILIKSAESLEIAHNIDTIILDKTGTITTGHMAVQDIVPLASFRKQQLLQYAASLEKHSEHPLGAAIVQYVKDQAMNLVEVSAFEAISGRGIQGMIENKLMLGGNEAMMREHKIDISMIKEKANELASLGRSPLYFAYDGECVGIIAVADSVKEHSAIAIKRLKAMGIKVMMLTGDHKKNAESLQSQLALDEVIAEVLPHEKEAVVAQYVQAGHVVGMVGDGINDAPALTSASVGIAIGAGSDIAIESADIVLIRSDLLDVVSAIELSKAVIRNIKENLFWAFFYNTIGIPLAAGVFYTMLGWKLNPMFGAAAMSLSSVCVVSNALRLRLFKPKNQVQTNDNSYIKEELPKEREEEKKMTKVIQIEGMSCMHCVAHVEKALQAIPGVEVTVNLEQANAVVSLSQAVSDEVLTAAIVDAGYQVIGIA